MASCKLYDEIPQPDPWTTRKLPQELRPAALPEKEGSHWLGVDLAQCSGRPEGEAEPLYNLGLAAWTFINDSTAPWSAFDVKAFTGFLLVTGGQYDLLRLLELLREVDLLIDYLACCGEIDARRRRTLLKEAKEAYTVFCRQLH